MTQYNHRYINRKDKIEKHTYNDFEIISEFHGAEGYDIYTRRCKKCGKTVCDSN